MDIVVSIAKGCIVVEQPRMNARWTFGEQDAAVELIAGEVAENSVPVSFDASCEAPADHGRPGFQKAVFVEAIQDAIYDLQSASRPRAA